MSRITAATALVLATVFISSCSDHDPKDTSTAYDATLAAELGADEYGMRTYVFGMLRTGPSDDEITDKAQRAELFAGHFANMSKMAEEGKLVPAINLICSLYKRLAHTRKCLIEHRVSCRL